MYVSVNECMLVKVGFNKGLYQEFWVNSESNNDLMTN